MLQIAAGLVLGVFPTVMTAQSLPVSPATQPAEQPAAQRDGARILVLAFAPAQASDADWISRAVQQSVVADLSRATTGWPLQAISDSTPVNSTNDAIEAGRKASAKYVVTGNYQLIEPNLKLTGQVIDVETGKVVGGMKSTGSVRELFDMQDRIAGQVRFAIANEHMASKKQPDAVATAPKTPEPPPTIEPLGPVIAAQRPYDDSDLSRAVADDVSLIDRYDAAGQSYRQRYYDDSYFNGYPLYYSSYPYYGGYRYGSYFYFNYYRPCPPAPCRPYKDQPCGQHGRHRDDRSDASTDQNESPRKYTITDSSPAPTRQAAFNHFNGTNPTTVQPVANTDYANNPPKYVRLQGGNSFATHQQRTGSASGQNYVQAPPSTVQNVPAKTVNGSSNGVKSTSQLRSTAR